MAIKSFFAYSHSSAFHIRCDKSVADPGISFSYPQVPAFHSLAWNTGSISPSYWPRIISALSGFPPWFPLEWIVLPLRLSLTIAGGMFPSN